MENMKFYFVWFNGICFICCKWNIWKINITQKSKIKNIIFTLPEKKYIMRTRTLKKSDNSTSSIKWYKGSRKLKRYWQRKRWIWSEDYTKTKKKKIIDKPKIDVEFPRYKQQKRIEFHKEHYCEECGIIINKEKNQIDKKYIEKTKTFHWN